jgi:hypothetical protein
MDQVVDLDSLATWARVITEEGGMGCFPKSRKQGEK